MQSSRWKARSYLNHLTSGPSNPRPSPSIVICPLEPESAQKLSIPGQWSAQRPPGKLRLPVQRSMPQFMQPPVLQSISRSKQRSEQPFVQRRLQRVEPRTVQPRVQVEVQVRIEGEVDLKTQANIERAILLPVLPGVLRDVLRTIHPRTQREGQVEAEVRVESVSGLGTRSEGSVSLGHDPKCRTFGSCPAPVMSPPVPDGLRIGERSFVECGRRVAAFPGPSVRAGKAGAAFPQSKAAAFCQALLAGVYH
jgi:hypothetical protein